MELDGKLPRLIRYLLDESGRSDAVPDGEEAQKRMFRALCNVRPSMPISDRFLELQDEYLSEQTTLRGVVDVNGLQYNGNDIAWWQGDITRLDVDAVVNACNSALLGCFVPLHNCIDNAIHSNAGVQVRLDCNELMRGGSEPNGRVKVTKAYNLPSRYIFHTVGPIVRGKATEQNEADLKSCYLSCLDKAAEMELKSIAFCCISTGVFGYPAAEACALAVRTVKQWKKSTHSDMKIIFDVFTDEDRRLYENELSKA